MVKYERKILQINKIKEIDMKTLIVTGGSLDISWAKDFVRTINAEYIIQLTVVLNILMNSDLCRI